MPIRNRIVAHVRIRAGQLVPHEMNPRLHSDAQRHALTQLYDEIGFARSLLAYRLPDGRLKLIDGHLRQSMSPEMEVDVEVLDVTDAEARALLLAIDPLAQLAGYETETLADLRALVEKDSAAVASLWDALNEANRKTRDAFQHVGEREIPPQFFVLIECANEAEQLEMLARFHDEGLKCQAKMG